nr:MAG TPA: hypothetical protein [Crassvirales sp.]
MPVNCPSNFSILIDLIVVFIIQSSYDCYDLINNDHVCVVQHDQLRQCDKPEFVLFVNELK